MNTSTMTLRDLLELEVHPAAEMFSMLWDSAEAPNGVEAMITTIPRLAGDIGANGLRDPLIIRKSTMQLVDGRNRRAAMKGLIKNDHYPQWTEDTLVQVRFEDLEEEWQVYQYVRNAQLNRRSTTKSQWAVAALSEWDTYSNGKWKNTNLAPAVEWEIQHRLKRLEKKNPGTDTRKVDIETPDVLALIFPVSAEMIKDARSIQLMDQANRAKFEALEADPDTDPTDLETLRPRLNKLQQVKEGRVSIGQLKKSPGQKINNTPWKRRHGQEEEWQAAFGEELDRRTKALNDALEMLLDQESAIQKFLKEGADPSDLMEKVEFFEKTAQRMLEQSATWKASLRDMFKDK